LAKVKKGTGSSEPMLGADVTVPGRRQILGAPLLAAPDAADGVVWGIDSMYSTLVVREGSTVDVDGSVFFTSDRVAIRCKTRLGFAFPHPASIVKIQVSA
jgi:HK97 family phage major capsid protein